MVDLSRYHVLLVLEDESQRAKIANSLAEICLRTTNAVSADQALELSSEDHPQVIVTDSRSKAQWFDNYPVVLLDQTESPRPSIRDRVISALFPPAGQKSRIAARLPIRKNISWEFSGFAQTLGGTITNISSGGAFIASGGLLPYPGETISIGFGENGEQCTGLGIVRWIRTRDSQSPKGFGIEFLTRNEKFSDFVESL